MQENNEKKTLSARSLVGDTATRERVENDYYATPFGSTEALLEVHPLKEGLILEPAVGQAHIVKPIKDKYPNAVVYGSDLVQRELIADNLLEAFKERNFLESEGSEMFNTVITNPPFKYAQEFIEKSFEHVPVGGGDYYVC